MEGGLITKGHDVGRMGEGDSRSFPKTVLSPVYRWRRGGSEIVSNFSQGYRRSGRSNINLPRALLPGDWKETGSLRKNVELKNWINSSLQKEKNNKCTTSLPNREWRGEKRTFAALEKVG